MTSLEYDIVVVGAGIAGSTVAHALSSLSTRPRVALLERSLATPDRIVGELLQPTGVNSLKKLGLEWTLSDIHAAKVMGYYVWDGTRGTGVQISYPGPEGRHQGRSFHHGSFIDQLRKAASNNANVDLLEATVSELVWEHGRVAGVRAKVGPEKTTFVYRAPLTIIADGCFSMFRSQLLSSVSTTKSHFVGAVIKNAQLPMKHHGTVCLVPNGYGPALLYQIHEPDNEGEETHTRLLVDVKAPLPRDLKAHMITNVIPSLPEYLHQPILDALSESRIRTMPNSFLPPSPQSALLPPGVFALGDAYNMRHPLTGGGMSVALNDVVILRDLFASRPEKFWTEDATMRSILEDWYWRRRPLSSTINILSVALYDLFGADDRNLAILRNGCFKYFELGGECVDGPVSLLAGIKPSPMLLFIHFFAVAFYSIIVLFTRSNPASLYSPSLKGERRARPWEWPSLVLRGFIVFATAVQVFGPLLWTEIRWWPTGPSPSRPGSSKEQFTSTTRGPLKHDQQYSDSWGMRSMALIACLASVMVYSQVMEPYYGHAGGSAAVVDADGGTVGLTYALSAMKSNVGESLDSVWQSFAEK